MVATWTHDWETEAVKNHWLLLPYLDNVPLYSILCLAFFLKKNVKFSKYFPYTCSGHTLTLRKKKAWDLSFCPNLAPTLVDTVVVNVNITSYLPVLYIMSWPLILMSVRHWGPTDYVPYCEEKNNKKSKDTRVQCYYINLHFIISVRLIFAGYLFLEWV